jgi:hypothetical protein
MVYMQAGGKGYRVVSVTAGVENILVDTDSFDVAWNVWVDVVTKP